MGIFLYLLLLLLIVYIPECLRQVLMSSYDDGYTTLFKDWYPWLHPLIRSSGSTARVILGESALGFSLGSFLQMRKEKKKQNDREQ